LIRCRAQRSHFPIASREASAVNRRNAQNASTAQAANFVSRIPVTLRAERPGGDQR
jgi:hypothetical protein